MTRTIHNRFVEIAADLSPTLTEAIAEVGPVRLKRRNDIPLAEVLCRMIAGQQLSVKAARTIWSRIVDSAGQTPLIDHVSAVSPDLLRRCGLSQSKAKAMKAIVRADAGGDLDAAELSKLDHEARSQRLTAVWGIGQWTADMIGIGYFGDKDIWPEGDVTVWKTLERLTTRRRKTTPR